MNPRDKIQENYGMYGPYDSNEDHPDEPHGIKFKLGKNYYVQRI